ncbi:sulfite exporter TauE/SafE family protein [Azospirillum picis]|uniref:Probable membrane transporter protein n=1 Tax=Azospirillum picis TaxID=488438 RepID=A0ABU0MNC9_9PROT|nr:sulfite exporter TauE/SafE family protein [Azospirillum picis]MBP2301865.1 putative membrane protein YfcA [Azospirillum picis]MDQ0534960.1 putative membrane protein YfcA [Azospirillum picis]
MSMVLFGGVTFVAAAFRGVTGFGYALIAALGLLLLPSPTAGVPFILVADLMLTAFLLLDRDQGAVDWTVTRRLLAGGFAGALCGSLLAVQLDEATSKLLVAVAIFAAACVALVRRPPSWLAHRSFGAVIAFVVGGLLAAFAVGGPLMAAWLLAGGRDRRTIKGTLAVFFGAVDALSLVGRGLLGALDAEVIGLLAAFTLPTLAGFAAGRLLASRLGFDAWRRLASGGLLAVAIGGLIQAGFALKVGFLQH